jgi:MauM/NapG family ferredoxin protein
MRKIKITIQILSVVLFTVFLLFFNLNPTAYTFDSDFFLKLNPLSALLVTLASHKVIVNLLVISSIVLVITILFGRVFCGAACPLGALIDFNDMLFSKIRSSERKPPRYFHRLKFVLLCMLIILSIFGVLYPLFFDPFLLSTRIFTYVFDPLLRIISNNAEQSVAFFSQSTADYLAQTVPVRVPLYIGVSLTIGLMLVIFGGTFWDKRFWCQYICPTGAFLGLLSHFSLFRRHVAIEKCNTCQHCARSCPVGAINPKDVHKTSVSECIDCGICVELKEHCSTFKLAAPSTVNTIKPDLRRRHLLAGFGGGLLLLPVFKATATLRRDDHGKLIRPPGAIPELEFKKQCIACGECIKACPTNALQPCMITDGFDRLYTPKIVPKIGGCEGKCALCGHVCPTSAIRKLAIEDKPFVKIGTAVLDRNRCIAWEQNKDCVVCDEVCPYNAIDAKELETTGGVFKVPVVKEDLCMGCGICENNCPVNDIAAITVSRFGENRKSSGAYLNDRQKTTMIENRKKTGMETMSSGFSDNESKPVKNSSLPNGFSD